MGREPDGAERDGKDGPGRGKDNSESVYGNGLRRVDCLGSDGDSLRDCTPDCRHRYSIRGEGKRTVSSLQSEYNQKKWRSKIRVHTMNW